MTYRAGIGFDIHKLEAGRKLILGGVEIPCENGLLGHSDADVLIHSIIDALLGALCLGDIGQHFPPDNPDYKDVESTKLLFKVMKLVESKQYQLLNLDSNIIAEKPRLQEYILPIRKQLAEILNVEIECVSVKAKTNEKLGPVGRYEGIEAQTIVLLEKIHT